MQQFFGWVSPFVMALALPYFAISVALGIRLATRGGLKLSSQEREEPAVEAERHDGLYFIVAVMDADGRRRAGAIGSALALFSDPRVGGVQLVVRIRDRRKLIGQFQDSEDLDLGLRLIAKGWRITAPVHGYVDQQPFDTLPRLLRQLTHWYQGSRSQEEHVGAPATATVAPAQVRALTITGDRELA